MRAALLTILMLASACSFHRRTPLTPQPQKSALSRCYVEGCAQPLFVVDGKVLSASSVDLNPSDIATVEVFKGELALKQYGEEGKHGVVVITTKRAAKAGT